MQELHLPWLELSVLIPLVGAITIGLIKNRNTAYLQCVAICILTFLCALGECIDFMTLHIFEAHDHWDLLESIFHRDIFVIDELNAPLLPLASLLYLMMILSTLKTKLGRLSMGWMLFSEGILIATLSCRDPWIIITLMAIATVPPWIEMKSRQQSTGVYTLHMGLFVGLSIIGWWIIPKDAAGIPNTESNFILIGGGMLTAAGLLRSGIVPIHCWMTDLFEKAAFGTALLFVTPMTGAYMIMRIVLPIAPPWALQSIAIVSLITAIYAAGMALVQSDSRRFFCYLFLSHSSLVLVGMEFLTPIGLTGALCIWISVGLSLGGFGLIIRAVEARMGRLSLSKYHGLYDHMPTFAGLFLLTGLASIGFPGTIGFIGMELILEGAVEVSPLIGTFVVLTAALNGIAIMHAYFRIFTGTKHVATISLKAKPQERFAVLVLTFLIIGGGLYPQPGISSRYHAAKELIAHRQFKDKTDSKTQTLKHQSKDHP